MLRATTRSCAIAIAVGLLMAATVAAQTPVLTSSTTASGTVGSAFSYTATFNNSPTSYLESGTLPPGATWNASNATVSGTAITAGTFTPSFAATNSHGTGSYYPVTVTIAKGGQASVSSSNVTIGLGSSFAPIETGGSGTGGWEFVIAGYTNWDGGTDSHVGTNLGSSWSSTWTPTASGTYQFYIVRNGDANYNGSAAAGPYTLTVLNTPLLTSSTSASATVGVAFSYTATFSNNPTSYLESGEFPSGLAWNESTAVLSGTPTTAGTYTPSFAATNADGTGTLSAVTITVAKGSQASISSANATITLGASFSPIETGGSGSGGWEFVIAGYTNWDGGSDSIVGTNLGNSGSPNWSPTWTPTAAGSYSFYVIRNGDANYGASSAAGPYTLTVTSGPTPTPPPTIQLKLLAPTS